MFISKVTKIRGVKNQLVKIFNVFEKNKSYIYVNFRRESNQFLNK